MKPCHCDNMNEPRGYYAKGNKSDRKRQIPCISYVESKKKNQTNKTKWKQTHRCREQTGNCHRGGVRGVGEIGGGN